MTDHNNTILEHLGARVAELTNALAELLRAGGHPQPSLSVDGPLRYPQDTKILDTRSKLHDTLLKLIHLTTGPAQFWVDLAKPISEVATVAVCHEFDFFSAIPLDRSASYAEVASKTTLPEQMVRRFIRQAMAMQIVAPDPLDPEHRIMHTAFSAFVLRTPNMRAFLEYCVVDTPHIFTRAPEALRRYFGGRSEPNDDLLAAPFTLALEPNGKERGMLIWEYYDRNPDKAKMFAGAMAYINESGAFGVHEAIQAFDWDSLGDATVVDVGGSDGHIALQLALAYPRLTFIVQDRPAVEQAFNANIPAELANSARIRFQPHDFLQLQETPGDIYLLKHVLHDWPDASAVQILRNLVPALEGRQPSSPRILIADAVAPPDFDDKGDPTMPLHLRRHMATLDMMMFAMCNARDRKMEDWLAVLKRADERLKVVNVYSPPQAPVTILEVVLREG